MAERTDVIVDRPGDRHRVVVVGAGFGGLNAARGLRRTDAEVVVVDRVNHHLFQPLLYQVATALLPPGDIAPPLRQVLGKRNRVVLGEATDVDVAERTVTLTQTDGRTRLLGYDSLVVAVGSTDSYFGHDEWRRWAPPMKTLDDAVALRGRVLGAFERAAVATVDAVRRRDLTFAIIGAGPTGVELAGQLAAMTRRTLRGQYPELDLDEVRVVLMDALDHVLPPYAPALRRHTEAKLRALGVDVRLGRKVEQVDEDGVVSAPTAGGEPERLSAGTVVWAAGVRAAPLTAKLAASAGVDSDKRGRLVVRDDCTVPGHPEVFVIGDTANHRDLPGVAEPAIQQGKYVAKVLRARLAGGSAPGPFRYLDLGVMATISAGDAVADVRGLRLRGLVGKVAWSVVHLAFLVGWRNRAAVLAEWAWTVTTGRRNQRVILEPVRA
ncbi:NAD(P)/FAD-dependent oxidoreductase [Actinokineospora sp. NBRC 105648]|uniref:NAD(P)/FAD-dependent oxidoreductase n=1 Tax=Actinokineospora sp. NBRC 105648 TaxID=3032206 RepID=UPI0024A1411D|nr:NAD(P)/FAD-dependent oxidoreductase [Actinokineospora sp. NBRC 105648]GLZ40549.1 putative NADH dehydrogenase (NDH) [Actinokineospora sp. NBRC 105648]